MEIIAYAFGICAFVFGTIAALFGVIHYRDACIWTTCAAIVLAVIGGFCWLQDREWKKDAASQRLLRITGVALSEECDKWIESGKALRERLVNPDSQKQAVE